MTPPPVDVAIVGAGITGTATALALAGAGLRVAVFERGAPGAEQSSRAWGFVRQQGRHPAELPLAAEASALWRELTAKHGAAATGFREGGILTPAATDADEAMITGAHREATGFGLRTRLLAPAALRALLPRLAGAVMHAGTPVLGIGMAGGTVEGVVTARGLVRAGAVLLANGVGAARLARGVGLALPVPAPRRSHPSTGARSRTIWRPSAPCSRIWARSGWRPPGPGAST